MDFNFKCRTYIRHVFFLLLRLNQLFFSLNFLVDLPLPYTLGVIFGIFLFFVSLVFGLLGILQMNELSELLIDFFVLCHVQAG